MPTTLAEQLQRLAVPQSSIYVKDKKQHSLLFDPKVAALKDKETFYEIGLSGLQELVTLNKDFASFENTLFSTSSKEFERAVQTKEANKKLDEDIEKFLMRLSPYFLLQSSHKALEWLINRFHIQEYNQDDIIKLILPYHETKIFVRCLQILKIDSAKSKWSWLVPLQKPGIPLTKSVLVNRAKTDLWFLKFISKMTVKAIKAFGEAAHSLTTLTAFYCTTIIGVLNSVHLVTEGQMSAIIPTLMKALTSTTKDFYSSGLMIFAQLIAKAQLKADTIESLLKKLINSETRISYDTVLMLQLTYQSQTSLDCVSADILNDLSPEQMKTLSTILNELLIRETDITTIVKCFLKGTLILLQTNMENFKRYEDFPEIIISNIDFNDKQCETIIECILDCFSRPAEKQALDDSDIELVEVNDTFDKMEEWYSSLLKRVSVKYPDVTDKIIKRIFHDGGTLSKKSNKLKSILTFHPSAAHNMGNTELFTELYHYNAINRIEALTYIIDDFEKVSMGNKDFVFSSILERLGDDDPEVVLTVLKLPRKDLLSVINKDIPLAKKNMQNILRKGFRDPISWLQVANKVVEIFCLIDVVLDVDTIFSILPYLFPENENSVKTTLKIVQSDFAQKFPLIGMCAKAISDRNTMDPNTISKTVFGVIESHTWLYDVESYMKDFRFTGYDCTDVMIYTILQTNLLTSSISPKDGLYILQEVLNAVDSCDFSCLGMINNENVLNGKSVVPCLHLCKEDKLPVQVLSYSINSIIKQCSFTMVFSSGVWLSLDSISEESNLIMRLFDIIITGCGHKDHSPVYASLMNAFMEKICPDLRSKFFFLANFALGHVVKNSESYSISPELQLRSLKLLKAMIGLMSDFDWLYDLNIMLILLLSLNCSISPIRLEGLKIINLIVQKDETQDNCMFYLLSELNERSEEISLDHRQLPLILFTLLSQDRAVKSTLNKKLQIEMKKCLHELLAILHKLPSHILAALLSELVHINSQDILNAILGITIDMLQGLKERTKVPSVYDYQIIQLVINRINGNVLHSMTECHSLWKLICTLVSQYELVFECDDGSMTSTCSMLLKQIDEECFAKIPLELSKHLIQLVCEAGTYGNNAFTVSSASKFIRRLSLSSHHFEQILHAMIDIRDPLSSNLKSFKKISSVPSPTILDTLEWKRGVMLLEYIQNKKRININHSDIPQLFKVLKKCLDFEEQSALEYVKQLLLSCILHWCQKCVDIESLKQSEISESAFDIELIVKCIRGTQNPQTHHHALVLLAHLAFILPNQVLHHTMAIFTFIGSSVLRHDDAYSFQIISKIIETVVPVLMKFNGNIIECSEEKLKEIQNVVIPMLRIFVDAVLDVPEHRRTPLYTKLIDTLGSSHFLWIFGALLFEAHVVHDSANRLPRESSRTLADSEKPVSRMDFGVSLFCEFSANVILENMVKLIAYLQTLPIERTEDDMEMSEVDTSEIFNVATHTAKQLRHFKYTIITFMNNLLSAPSFQYRIENVTDQKEMETNYRVIVVNILTFIQFVSKNADQNSARPQGKYWKVMLHHSYELLENVNNLLSPSMFIIVIRGLMTHNLIAVCRKSMEILNMKLQHSPIFFADCDRNLMYSLLEPTMIIIQTIKSKKAEEIKRQDLQFNQQTALLSLKLLTRLLCHTDPAPFKAILCTITDLVRIEEIDSNVMASIVLCLAELCANLKAHAISNLPKYMPQLLRILKLQRKVQAPELILLSVLTAVYKIVESLPLFLSPYLEKILFELSILHAKWKRSTYDSTKVSPVITKLLSVNSKVATTISPRILVPLISQCYNRLIDKKHYDSVAPLMSVLAESFSTTSGSDLTSLIQEITSFALVALQLRCEHSDSSAMDQKLINNAEEEVVKALVALILKLSETSFRPFYFKIYDWALRSNVENHKDRAITFYRLSSAIAQSLKGLFVLFAGHFIKNAAELLDVCNAAKADLLYYESPEKCSTLVQYILKTLYTVFLYDSQNFINKEKFETLMQPIVDQLENTVDGLDSLENRAKDLITPCIAQFAVATADDSLWKPLNYQILLKTRHNESEIRLLAVDCLVTTAKRLGQGWLPLLAESVPFLSELMEDGDVQVDEAAKAAVRELELVLGEPLQKYF